MRSRSPLSLALLAACLLLPACAAPSPGARTLSDKAQLQATLAERAAEAGNPAASARLYRAALAQNPDDAKTALALADALSRGGKLAEAEEAYQALLRKDPRDRAAQLGLGRVHLLLKRPDQALAAFAGAGDDPAARIGRGVALDMLGRHGEAQAEYRAVLAAAPANRTAANNLALSLALSGDLRQAEGLLVPLADGPGSEPRFRQNLALVYGLQGQDGRAAALARADLDPDAVRGNLAFYAAVRGAGP